LKRDIISVALEMDKDGNTTKGKVEGLISNQGFYAVNRPYSKDSIRGTLRKGFYVTHLKSGLAVSHLFNSEKIAKGVLDKLDQISLEEDDGNKDCDKIGYSNSLAIKMLKTLTAYYDEIGFWDGLKDVQEKYKEKF
jgi:hypothetical protein